MNLIVLLSIATIWLKKIYSLPKLYLYIYLPNLITTVFQLPKNSLIYSYYSKPGKKAKKNQSLVREDCKANLLIPSVTSANERRKTYYASPVL